MRKLRVIYSDPDATDASSDEEDPKTANESPVPAAKRFVRLVDLPDVTVPQKKYGRKQRAVHRIVTGGEIILPEKQRRQGNRILKSPYVGVRQRAAGTWASEIRNPFTKTRIWLGTFASAEEARAAYLAKRLEFEAEERSMGISNPVVVGSPSSVLESGCSVSPVEGSSDSSSSGSKRFSDADSGSRDLDLKLEIGSGVIDNNGFLLGEFSSLDDLRICKMEED